MKHIPHYNASGALVGWTDATREPVHLPSGVTHLNVDHPFFPVPACNHSSRGDRFTFDCTAVNCPDCKEQYS
jgi:hypothetical protein